MTFNNLKTGLLAAALVAGTAGAAFAQSSAPFPTGSVGNSNTGPGAQFGGHTGVLGSSGSSPYVLEDDDHMETGSVGPAPDYDAPQPFVDRTAPFPTGSVGNSNTGPGARPNY